MAQIEIAARKIEREKFPVIAPSNPRGAIAVTIYIADPRLPDETDQIYSTGQYYDSDDQIHPTKNRVDLIADLAGDTDWDTIHLPALQAFMAWYATVFESDKIPSAGR